MNRRRAIAEALIATPGLTVSEIGRAIGQTSAPHRNRISASLCSMARMGRVKHNNQPDSSGRRRWFATEQALVDRRRSTTPRRNGGLPAAKKANKPPKPPKSANVTIIQRTGPKPAYAPTARTETVEEWMIRTGEKPEVLDPHATAHPLRFDHAHHHITPRRCVIRHAKPGAP